MNLREVVSAIEKEMALSKESLSASVSAKNCVERRVETRQKAMLVPASRGGSVNTAMEHKAQLMTIFEQQPDATLAEYCELLFDTTGRWVEAKALCVGRSATRLATQNAAFQSGQK